MANIEISALNPAEELQAQDLFVVSQDGEARKLSGSDMLAQFGALLDGHGGIKDISLTSTVGSVSTYTITYADDTTTTYQVTNGVNGANGVGITAVNINEDKTITLILSNGRSYTTPSLEGPQGVQGPQGETGERGPAGVNVTGMTPPDPIAHGAVNTYVMTLSDGSTVNVPLYSGEDGTGGDMYKSVYDPSSTVANAGGIPSYVTAQVGTVTPTSIGAVASSTFSNHHARHASGGEDAISPSDIGAVASATFTAHHSRHEIGGADALPAADSLTAGLVKLYNGIDSTSASVAATANAAKKAYDGSIKIPSNPNLLDNWYFIGGGSQQGGGQLPINQCGQTTYSGTVFGIDRWHGSSSDITTTVVAGGITIACSSSVQSGDRLLRQRFDNYPNGVPCTASVLVTAVNGSFGISFGSKDTADNKIELNGITSAGLYTVTGTLDGITDGMVSIDADQGGEGSITISAIKFEVGSIQTLCIKDGTSYYIREVPNYQEQMTRCLSYCCVLNETHNAYARYGQGVAYSTTQARIIVPFPARMRSVPVLEGTTGTIKIESGSTNAAITSIKIDRACSDNATLEIVSSSLTAYRAYYLLDFSDGTSSMTFSADI